MTGEILFRETLLHCIICVHLTVYTIITSTPLHSILQLVWSEESSKVVKDALQGEPTVETLYYAFISMANTGMTSKIVHL